MPNLTATERPRRLLLHAARLFDGVSESHAEDSILIDGDTIVAIGAGLSAADAEVVELAGATVLPGIVDTHVHLAFDASMTPVAALAERDDTAALAAMTDAARTAAAGGVTTVRDLGDRGYLTLELRGRADLPTILAAGPPLTTPSGHCHYLGGVVGPGADGMRAAVREHAERGVDIIKIMASGGVLTPGTKEECAQFSEDELRAAVDEAHRLGLPVTAHVHAVTAIAAAVAAGVDAMEHVSFWTEDGVDAREQLVQLIAASKIFVGSTLGVVPYPGFTGPPPAVQARLPYIVASHMNMRKAGARMMVGSDAGISRAKPHDALRYAPAMLTTFGFTPVEALRTVTSGGAEACGLGDRKGRLAPGFDADLLVVDDDPLADPEALHRIRAVYLRGRRVR
jgi:imidazolonepropionase-like amidohydrolase